jgi:hypothetical protein
MLPSDAGNHAMLVHLVAGKMQMTQGEMAKYLGISRRTVNRWGSRGVGLAPFQAHDLARLVHPRDAALAAKLAAAGGATLESLGLEKKEPPPPPPDPPRHLVDVVVCAAADALDISPRQVRAALLAAFRRAREAGLTVENVEKALSPEPTPASTATQRRSMQRR